MAFALTNQTDNQSIEKCLKNNHEENFGEFTHTTATLTPTRLKSIEEQFFDSSLLLPPAQFIHEHMAGFRIPSQVNIQSMIKSFCNIVTTSSELPGTQISSNSSSNLAHSIFSPFTPSTTSLGQSDYNITIPSLNSCTLSGNTFPNSNSSETDNSNSSTQSQMATEPSGTDTNNFLTLSKRTMQTRKNDYRSSKVNSDKATVDGNSSAATSTKRSNCGGRKPKNDQVSPEEDLKRQKRRERNKIAAARCRKKRVDQTNDLEGLKNELASKHQALSEKMRHVMASYCSQEARIMDHLNRNCKNSASLHSNLPLLTSMDYDQIVNSMFVDWKDDQLNDETSSGKEGDNQDNCRSSTPIIATTSSQPASVILDNKLSTTMTIMQSSSVKAHAVPVISTVMSESNITFETGNDSSQISAQSKRPNSLILPNKIELSSEQNISGNDMIAQTSTIQTPSAGFFDSIDGSGTGLTPLQVPPTFSFLRSITTPLTDAPEDKTFTTM